jgi:hypothetical protein
VNICQKIHHHIQGEAMAKKTKIEVEPTEEIDLLDDMISSSVDLLIEHIVITEEEYEKKTKRRIK